MTNPTLVTLHIYACSVTWFRSLSFKRSVLKEEARLPLRSQVGLAGGPVSSEGGEEGGEEGAELGQPGWKLYVS